MEENYFCWLFCRLNGLSTFKSKIETFLTFLFETPYVHFPYLIGAEDHFCKN